MLSKACTNCRVIKGLDDYHKASKGKYGRKAICKDCCAKASKAAKPKKQTLREYYDKNPNAVKPLSAKRKARMLEGTGSFTAVEWKEVLKASNYSCVKCGSEDNITADHIVPLSRGGTNYIFNIQPLCWDCNSKKSNFYAEDFR